jgi:hypothetical protein
MSKRTTAARLTALVVAGLAAAAAWAAPAAAAPDITISNGLFVNTSSIAWLTAPSTTQGDRTVTRRTTGNAGITVTGPTGSVFHPTTGVSKYMFIGSRNHVLLLEMSNGAGPNTRRVSLVDFTTAPPAERPILAVTASSAAVPPPNVQFSQGTGDAFFTFASTGTQVVALGIHRSDTGDSLCAATPPASLNGQLVGEATATQLRIKSGGTVLRACTRPSGSAGVSTPEVTAQ